MKYHLFAHNDLNKVKKGDKVKKYKTIIGTIGSANGQYWSHLHHSISDDLTVPQLRKYIKGWTKEEVKKHYNKPTRTTDYEKMFGRKMDVGNAGYDWLQDIGNGFHPGIDINGFGGGNTDKGYPYKSSCDGTVIYVSETDAQDGWGKMVVVEEEANIEAVVYDGKPTPVTEKPEYEVTTPVEAIKPLEVNSETSGASYTATPDLYYDKEKQVWLINKKNNMDLLKMIYDNKAMKMAAWNALGAFLSVLTIYLGDLSPQYNIILVPAILAITKKINKK